MNEESRRCFHLPPFFTRTARPFPFTPCWKAQKLLKSGTHSMMECVPDCVILDVKGSPEQRNHWLDELRRWSSFSASFSHPDRSSFPFCTPLEGAPTFEIGHSMMECVPDCVILDVT
jgi:hypothetical protein